MQLTPMDEDELDEAVSELCQALSLDELNATDDADEQETIIASAEAAASEINNQGPEAQRAFLAEHGG